MPTSESARRGKSRNGIGVTLRVVHTGYETATGEIKFLAERSDPLRRDRTAKNLLVTVGRQVCTRSDRRCLSSTRTQISRMFVEIVPLGVNS